MLVSKSIQVRDNFKEYCNKVVDGETLIIARKNNENVVMVSETEYNDIQREREQLKLRVQVMAAEASRLAGEPTFSADEVFADLENIYV